MPCSKENLRIFTGIAQRAFWRPECGEDLNVAGSTFPVAPSRRKWKLLVRVEKPSLPSVTADSHWGKSKAVLPGFGDWENDEGVVYGLRHQQSLPGHSCQC